jgi:WD40 repeat protein
MVWSASFSPDSKFLATASYHSEDVFIHDVATWSSEVTKVHTGPFGRTTAFSPDGRWLVTTSNDCITLWRAGQYRTPVAVDRTAHGVQSIAFEPGGNTFVTAAGRVLRWDIRSDEGSPTQLEARTESIAADSVLSVPGRNSCLVAAASSMVRLVCGEPFAETLRISATSVAVALSPDGRLVVNQEADGTIAAWQLDGGGDTRRVAVGAAVRSVAAAKDQTWLAAGRKDGSLEVFDTRTWRGREVLRVPGPIEGLEVSADGRWCVVVTSSLFKVLDAETWKELKSEPYPGTLDAVRFAPDGRFLVAIGDKGVLVYGVSEWQKKFEVADDANIVHVAFDGKGSRIAVLTNRSGGGHDSGIHFARVTDLGSGKLLGWEYRTGGSNITHETMLRLIAERHTSQTGGDMALLAESKAWTPLPIRAPEEYPSADRRWVAKMSKSTLQLSRPGRTVPIGGWDQQSGVTGLLFLPQTEPHWLVSAGEDGLLRLWPLTGPDLVAETCARLKGSLTLEAWTKLASSISTSTSTLTCDPG